MQLETLQTKNKPVAPFSQSEAMDKEPKLYLLLLGFGTAYGGISHIFLAGDPLSSLWAELLRRPMQLFWNSLAGRTFGARCVM
jgi:hypothetical protein